MIHLLVKPRIAKSIPTQFKSSHDEILSKQLNTKLQAYYTPRANVLENDEKFVIQIELPGYSKSQVDLQIENGVLTVQNIDRNSEGKNLVKFHLKQIERGSFRRAFYLPENVNEEEILASFNNGILDIAIPKRQEKAQKKSIDIV